MPSVWILTGPIGSGKSTIRREFEALGTRTIDADQIAHDVYAPHGPLFGEISARWPETVVDGNVDRKMLAAIVFDDPVERVALEEMVHPEVALSILEELAAAGDEAVIVEISVPKDLLGVGPGAPIVADLEDSERFNRLLARGMDPADIARRMVSQPTREEWLALGNHVISTAGSPEDVSERVRRWVKTNLTG